MFWDGRAFHGAKIALIAGDRLLAYQRDDRPDIPFPGLWDLPGGGREGGESPQSCALRETAEEFGLAIDAATIRFCRAYGDARRPGSFAYFLLAPLAPARLAEVRFGDEGQRWQAMPVAEFLSRPDALPHLQSRLREALAATAGPSEGAASGPAG